MLFRECGEQSPSLREETASREALRSDMFKLRIAVTLGTGNVVFRYRRS